MTKLKANKELEQVYQNYKKDLKAAIEALDKRNTEIDNLQAANAKLEEQVTMSVGVIKYLEMQLEKRRV
jgi:uncharacterized protein YgiM (DUF1202 family)